jgi:hypothetical protein
LRNGAIEIYIGSFTPPDFCWVRLKCVSLRRCDERGNFQPPPQTFGCCLETRCAISVLRDIRKISGANRIL